MKTQTKLKVLLLIVLILTAWLGISPAKATSWMTGWTFRKQIDLEQTAGTGTNYDVGIKVYYTAGSDSYALILGDYWIVIHTSGQVQNDFDDVRFTQSDGVTLLSYSRAVCMTSNYADFWVKIPDDLSASDVSIYIYFGNPLVSDISNEAQTFLLGDNMEDDNFPNWDLHTGVHTNSTVKVQGTYSAYGNYNEGGASSKFLRKYNGITWRTTMRQIQCWVYNGGTGAWTGILFTDWSTTTYGGGLFLASGFGILQYGSDVKYMGSFTAKTWYRLKVTIYNATYWTSNVYDSTSLIASNSSATWWNMGVGSEEKVEMGGSVLSANSDYYFIRKYVVNELNLYSNSHSHGFESQTGTGLVYPFDTVILGLDAQDYVYADKTYTFNATYIATSGTPTVHYAKIAFNDGMRWINASYHDNAIYLESGQGIVTIGGKAFNLTDTILEVDFEIFFTNTINDAQDVDIYMYGISNENITDGWLLERADYFNIFNIGGNVELTTIGSAERISGGDIFDLHADASSQIKATQMWTKLHAIDAIFAINSVGNKTQDEGNGGDMWSIGFFYFGMDAYDPVEDRWSNWYAKVEVWDSYMGWAVPNTVHSFVIYDIKWYMNGVFTGKEDFVAGYWEGKDSSNDYVRMHVRLWFNKANASSVIGGWLSPAYYGTETTSAWDWITGGWSPKKTYQVGGINQPAVNSFLFKEFKDTDGNIMHYGDFTRQRFWVMLNRSADNPNYSYEISFTQKLDYTFKNDKEGIDTPAPLEPMLPDIPQGGIFGWIASTLSGLATGIFNTFSGGFSILARVIIGGIDALLQFIFGTPNMFSGFLTAVNNVLGQLGNIVANAGLFFINIVTAMVDFFTGFANVIVNIFNMVIWWITQMVMFIPNLITMFSDMWNGTGQFAGGIALRDMATLIGIGLLMWFAVGIEMNGFGWGLAQIESLANVIQVVLAILMWFFNILLQIVQFVLSFIPFVG